MLSLSGCPTEMTPTDAGVRTDTPVVTDTGVPVDAPATVDAPVLVDAPGACATGEISVRDVCLPSCGATAATLEDALVADLVPVAHYCRTPSLWVAVGAQVYDVTRRDEGLVVHFDLATWTATPGTAPAPTAVATASYTRLTTDEFVSPPFGGFVAVSPNEMRALFGYTTSRSGFVGGIFDFATADGAVVTSDAPGNFDAIFLSNARVIVNGLGLGTAADGQGLYELTAGMMGGDLVADGMGDASGSLYYWASEDLVVAGGGSFGTPFPTGESSRVFFVDPDDLSTTAHADLSSGDFVAAPSAFWPVPGEGLATPAYGAAGVDHLEVRYLARVSGDPVLGAPAALTTDATFESARELDGDIGLQHAGGILVVRQTD